MKTPSKFVPDAQVARLEIRTDSMMGISGSSMEKTRTYRVKTCVIEKAGRKWITVKGDSRRYQKAQRFSSECLIAEDRTAIIFDKWTTACVYMESICPYLIPE